MSIPILKYSLSTHNHRVNSFEFLSGEEQPKVYTTENLLSSVEMDEIIWASYRQIFSEHQTLSITREPALESQLRFSQITIRDFIKGLLMSSQFRYLNYDVNNNYRFVEMCVQRVLGRDIYNYRETLAFSILIASKGLESFIDFLLDSEEYIENFGDNIVPYQRRRIIFQRNKGEVPFNLKTPRLNYSFLDKQFMPQISWSGTVRRFRPQEQKPKAGDPALFLSMLDGIAFV
uniref:Phycobilisome rod-core linker polypeptide n=1 Tax=Pleurostichidium falkenbergii TaxID=121064 RepID=A0A4D6UUR2_9FLOR|nr:phycobilisome rod-core linker polypeptide [Pleurostichidium falkenbergii]QCH39622.1 phycobilisome rod-core linker polypeptide [Pleurostichidium falkenbergii]